MDPVLTPEELDQALEAHRWTARDWARSDGAALLASWAAAGATMPQIAKRIGVTVSTLRRWRATHVEIAHALDEADAFIAANPELTREGITVTCRDRALQEVRICLTPNLQPRPCAPDTRRDCSGSFLMPAPR